MFISVLVLTTPFLFVNFPPLPAQTFIPTTQHHKPALQTQSELTKYMQRPSTVTQHLSMTLPPIDSDGLTHLETSSTPLSESKTLKTTIQPVPEITLLPISRTNLSAFQETQSGPQIKTSTIKNYTTWPITTSRPQHFTTTDSPTSGRQHFRTSDSPTSGRQHFRTSDSPTSGHQHFRTSDSPTSGHQHFRTSDSPTSGRQHFRTSDSPTSGRQHFRTLDSPTSGRQHFRTSDSPSGPQNLNISDVPKYSVSLDNKVHAKTDAKTATFTVTQTQSTVLYKTDPMNWLWVIIITFFIISMCGGIIYILVKVRKKKRSGNLRTSIQNGGSYNKKKKNPVNDAWAGPMPASGEKEMEEGGEEEEEVRKKSKEGDEEQMVLSTFTTIQEGKAEALGGNLGENEADKAEVPLLQSTKEGGESDPLRVSLSSALLPPVADDGEGEQDGQAFCLTTAV